MIERWRFSMNSMTDDDTRLYLPFDFKPHHSQNTELLGSTLWLKKMQLIEDGSFAEAVVHTASQYIRLIHPCIDNKFINVVFDLASWILVIDDIIENSASANTTDSTIELLSTIKFICEFDHEQNPSLDDQHPAIKSFIDIRQRFMKQLPRKNHMHLMSAVSNQMSGFIWEICSNQAKSSISLNTYCAIRASSFGAQICYSLFLALNSIPINRMIEAKNEFVKMKNCIFLAVGIDNDLYSYEKEHTDGSRAFNIIDVIQQALNIDLYSSIRKTINLRNMLINRYTILNSSLSSETEIRCRAVHLEELLARNIHFGKTSERYRKPPEGATEGDNYFFSASYRFNTTNAFEKKEIKEILELAPLISSLWHDPATNPASQLD